jgi:serralysin
MCVLCGRLTDHREGPANPAAITATAAIAAAPGDKPIFSNRQVIDQILHENGVWQPGAVISYSFPTTRPITAFGKQYDGFNPFRPEQMATAKAAFDLWSDIARLSFVQGENVAGAEGHITFANSDTIAEGVWGFAFTDGRTRPVWVDRGANEIWRTPPGSYDFHAMLHEIGHTLSLVHPGSYDADGDNQILYANAAEYRQDSRQYTVMSYFSARETGANFNGNFPSTPMMHDILTMQYAYGRNYATRSGDTVYGFNSTAGREVYDFSLNSLPVLTLWDGGGVNALDLSGFFAPTDIDLRPGSFSSTSGLTFNISIAPGTFFQRFIGGGDKDKVQDNALDNFLRGNGGDDSFVLSMGGNDTVMGGDGEDSVALAGTPDDYYVTLNADGTMIVHGPLGAAMVLEVERFTFEGNGSTLTEAQMRDKTFNGLLYLASNPDLMPQFGMDMAALQHHWLTVGRAEGRSMASFNPLLYLAANKDLIEAFGFDLAASLRHYLRFGITEGRKTQGFDSLAYIAASPDRVDTISMGALGGVADYVRAGGKADSLFDGLAYIASYDDLRQSIGMNASVGVQHFLSKGYAEYREISFDPLVYLASNQDLARAFGADVNAAYAHYFRFGFAEGRAMGFSAFDYAGSNPDLVRAFGYDETALIRHYLDYGQHEGRSIRLFDVVGYAIANWIQGPDWQRAATERFLQQGGAGTPFGTDQALHALAPNQPLTDRLSDRADNDWFFFRGAAYQSYRLEVEFLGTTLPNGTLAQIELRDRNNKAVIIEFAQSGQKTVIDFFTQDAEDIHLSILSRATGPIDYRLSLIPKAPNSTPMAMGLGTEAADMGLIADDVNEQPPMFDLDRSIDGWLFA